MRRATLLLTIMAGAILLASGVALAASRLDQQQTVTSSGVGLDAAFPQAQAFTAGLSGSLDKVSVHAGLVGSTSAGDMLVSIQTLDATGYPSGTVLAGGSVPVGNFVVGGAKDWIEVPLSRPAPVTVGTRYALVVSSANAPQDGSFYSWSASLNDPYPGGDALGRDLGSGRWFTRTDGGVPMDFAFKTFVEADTAAPTGGVKINDGAKKTRSRAVELSLSANDGRGGSGVSQMCVSNSAASCASWEPYATSKAWTLPSGKGTKTVYVRYKDGAGNVSAAFKDTIRYAPRR